MMLGQRLKQERLKRNLNQEEFGKLLNLSEPTISCYERGDRSPSIKKLLLMARTLHVSLDYLLGQDMLLVKENSESYGMSVSKEEYFILKTLPHYKLLHRSLIMETDRTCKKLEKFLEKENK